MIIVLMGVSGNGKSTIGKQLSEQLGWPFLDADDFHTAKNISKMASGTALNDNDRWPWLDRLADKIIINTQQQKKWEKMPGWNEKYYD